MTRSTKIASFLDDKLRPFSAQSNIRAIPFIGDGFKEVQRKALWGIFSRGENSNTDSVERIAAYSCSVTDYHHGSVSMEESIVKMAQRFPGTNNLPVLKDDGQFGSRKNFDSSASRYIKTAIDPNFRKVFLKDDDCIIEQLHNGDLEIEPKFFIPCIPLILCNGADGIGTGHATDILQYNPKDIQQAIKKILNGENVAKHSLTPWFGEAFTGTVKKDATTGQVEIVGKWEFYKKNRSNFLKITELPVGTQGDNYKKMLDKMESEGVILDYDNLSDKNGFEFIIKVTPETVEMPTDKLVKMFKLVSKTTENFTVWNPDGKIVRYDCAEDLLVDWIAWRLDQYTIRFTKQIEILSRDLDWANQKKKWIQLYLADPLFFRDNENSEILQLMTKNGLTRTDDLLSIPMRSLTKAKIEELEKQIVGIEKEIVRIKSLDEVSVMLQDLKPFK